MPQIPSDTSKNAIWVSRSLVDCLRSALKRKASPLDILPSDREILDQVVPQMIKAMTTPVYYAGRRDIQNNGYKWFNSEVVTYVQSLNILVDKGRFVDACIIGYLYGGKGLAKWCVGSKVIRPRVLGQGEISQISKTAAEIAAAKDTDSSFLPTTEDLETSESGLSGDPVTG